MLEVAADFLVGFGSTDLKRTEITLVTQGGCHGHVPDALPHHPGKEKGTGYFILPRRC
jgi:hypothetical protein